MPIDVRTIHADELPAYVDTFTTAFLERLDPAKVAAELEPIWDLQRVWAAFDGDRLCGTFRSWATELTVPGGAQLPAPRSRRSPCSPPTDGVGSSAR